MPRTLPIGEIVRRRGEVVARVKARYEERKELRRKVKAKENFRQWSNKWHRRKYQERIAALIPLREELRRMRKQKAECQLHGLPTNQYRKLTPDILELCVQASCIEFDTIPLLLNTPPRYAPDKKTKEVIYLIWWLARHKFRVSVVEIARFYHTGTRTVQRYTQDAQFVYCRHRDHPLRWTLRRLNELVEMLRKCRVDEYQAKRISVPRELLKVHSKKQSRSPLRRLNIATAQIGAIRYQFSEVAFSAFGQQQRAQV